MCVALVVIPLTSGKHSPYVHYWLSCTLHTCKKCVAFPINEHVLLVDPSLLEYHTIRNLPSYL